MSFANQRLGPLDPIFDEEKRTGAIQVGNTPPTTDACFTWEITDTLEITFDAGCSAGADSYQWDFGDSNNSTTGPVVVHTYSAPGIYEVSLVIIHNGVPSDPYTLWVTTACVSMTGGTVTTEGQFTVHTFTATGANALTVIDGGPCQVLCVGGGGGANSAVGGGGGGAGEYAVDMNLEITSSETVTVGIGGTGSSSGSFDGNDGGSSSIGSLITAAGGGGGAQSTDDGHAGACGGGGGRGTAIGGTLGGAGSAGGDGGNGAGGGSNADRRGGGGGGMGGNGENGVLASAVAAGGGPGVSTFDGILRCQGGEAGGGGTHSATAPPPANSGSGGNGGSSSWDDGANGIVIIKYLSCT